MFADRARIFIRSGKAEMDTSVSEENFMYRTEVQMAETVEKAET